MTTLSDVASQLSEQVIEQPCWAFGDSGARCTVLTQAGVARNVFEKIDDAAQVHKHTGVAPKVALHMLWDKTDSYRALRKHAENHGLWLGTIHSNTFQGEDYRLCSVTHSDRKVRQEAIDHHFACIDIMGETGSRDLKVWIADGVSFPGQGDLRSRQLRICLFGIHPIANSGIEFVIHRNETARLCSPKKIAVNLLIAVFKENRFSTIATLRHVVRETGYHHAGQTRHERKLTTNQHRGK